MKEWIETLPPDFLEFDIVNAEEVKIDELGDVYYRHDKPIVSLNVDKNSKEILFLNKPTNINNKS